jgi:hypothetical protein
MTDPLFSILLLYFDRLWKIQNLFEILNRAFSEFYSASKCLAVDEVIFFFKGRLVSKH